MLLPIIIATTIVSLISVVGVVLIFNKKISDSFLTSLISLAAGSLLAVALLDLLPEAIESGQFEVQTIFGAVLTSILFFFLLERTLHWHHCRCDDLNRERQKNKKYLAYFNLAGDGIHNLIDGFLIASAFMIRYELGVVVTLAVILHEIPQEISDFGVLLYAGLTKIKAIVYNLATALTAVSGAILFFFFGSNFESIIPLMAAFAAGNFIYLATADLMPDLHQETNPHKIVIHSIWLVVGVAIIFIAGRLIPHAG